MAYAAGQHPPEDVLYLTWKDGLLNCNEGEGEKHNMCDMLLVLFALIS
jgi:hypothetical protein